MKNSELAKQAYAFEEVVRDVFYQCIPALIGEYHTFSHFKLTEDGVEIIGFDYRFDDEHTSVYIPYADLDDMDAYIAKCLVENAGENRQKEEARLANEVRKNEEVEEKS
jgi:hypothetical protein